jgi:hypothetical protein
MGADTPKIWSKKKQKIITKVRQKLGLFAGQSSAKIK